MAIEDLVTKGDLERFVSDLVNSPGAVDKTAINGLGASLDGLLGSVTPSDWVTPTLLPGWAQYGDPAYSQVAYRTLGKKVDIRGLVAGAPFASSNIFVLPPDLAPEKHQLFVCMSSGGFGYRVDVKSDGTVVTGLSLGEGGLAWLSLDPISFWAAD